MPVPGTVALGFLADLFTEVCGPIRTTDSDDTNAVTKEKVETQSQSQSQSQKSGKDGWRYTEANGFRATTRVEHVLLDNFSRLTLERKSEPEPTLLVFARPVEEDEEEFPSQVRPFTWAERFAFSGVDLFWKIMGVSLSGTSNRAFLCALEMVGLLDFCFVESRSGGSGGGKGERWAIKEMGLVQGSIAPGTFVPLAVILDWTDEDLQRMKQGEGQTPVAKPAKEGGSASSSSSSSSGSDSLGLSEGCNILLQTGKHHEWLYAVLENDVVYWADFVAPQFDRFTYRPNTSAPYTLAQPSSEKFRGYRAERQFSVSKRGLTEVYPTITIPTTTTTTNNNTNSTPTVTVTVTEPILVLPQSQLASPWLLQDISTAVVVENLTMMFASLLVQVVPDCRFTATGTRAFSEYLTRLSHANKAKQEEK